MINQTGSLQTPLESIRKVEFWQDKERLLITSKEGFVEEFSGSASFIIFIVIENFLGKAAEIKGVE